VEAFSEDFAYFPVLAGVKNMVLRSLCCKIMIGGGLLAGICPASFAVDSVSLEIGTGNRTRLTRAGMQWAWERQWRNSDGTHVGGYWDLTLAQWQSSRYRNQPGNKHLLTAIGITPVFRFQNDSLAGLYGEAGIGLHHLFDLYDNNGRQLSTNFEFASHVGVGYVFQNSLDIGVKIQHFSNGSIKKPNNGVNFIVLRTSYRF
jgi:lipid A 3-O-deacylase